MQGFFSNVLIHYLNDYPPNRFAFLFFCSCSFFCLPLKGFLWGMILHHAITHIKPQDSWMSQVVQLTTPEAARAKDFYCNNASVLQPTQSDITLSQLGEWNQITWREPRRVAFHYNVIARLSQHHYSMSCSAVVSSWALLQRTKHMHKLPVLPTVSLLTTAVWKTKTVKLRCNWINWNQ